MLRVIYYNNFQTLVLRTDKYGGSIENRTRFSLEVVDALIDAVGPEKVGIILLPFYKSSGMLDADEPEVFEMYAYLLDQLEKEPKMVTALLMFILSKQG